MVGHPASNLLGEVESAIVCLKQAAQHRLFHSSFSVVEQSPLELIVRCHVCKHGTAFRRGVVPLRNPAVVQLETARMILHIWSVRDTSVLLPGERACASSSAGFTVRKLHVKKGQEVRRFRERAAGYFRLGEREQIARGTGRPKVAADRMATKTTAVAGQGREETDSQQRSDYCRLTERAETDKKPTKAKQSQESGHKHDTAVNFCTRSQQSCRAYRRASSAPAPGRRAYPAPGAGRTSQTRRSWSLRTQTTAQTSSPSRSPSTNAL